MNKFRTNAITAGIKPERPEQLRRAGLYCAGYKARQTIRRYIIFLCASLFAITTVCPAQQANSNAGREANDHARRSFAARCAACHGLDGRGGEHAPAIVNTPAAQARSDEALAAIIRSGIPDKGMPSFHFLSNQQIEEIISYIRTLRGGGGSAANLKGDPAAGSKLFFGEARCSDCHMMQGKGGFLGSDLSKFGRTHSARDIREMIVQPEKVLDPRWQMVRIVTHSGQHFSGLARNEDNFSIALLSEDGVFHLLMKSEIAQITREPGSIMPDDYGKTLSTTQLDDLASFLALGSASKRPRANKVSSSHSE
ncbi:MAG: c-type cytochrome [Acidobacteria bacterium]|nr:MAG: c-type cytochrome [Acidobacteriota bacterium]